MAGDVRQTETAMEDFASAESEWDNVREITAQFRREVEEDEEGVDDGGEGGTEVVRAPPCSPLVTVEEVLHHLKTQPDLDHYLGLVKPASRRGGVRRLLSCLLGPPSLPPHLRQSVRLVQATALMAFSNQESLHLGMLRTIYRQLTSTTLDCPRYGSHWEEIGFQGSDPSTDLRGVGILGLLQALYLVMTPEIFPFTQDLYRLSRQEGQEFPLLVLSLNMTRITVQVIRDGILNKHLQLEEEVWPTANFFYAALLQQVFHHWRTRHLTIRDCGPLIQQTEQAARTRPGSLLAQFERFLTSQYSVASKQAAREQIQRYSGTSSTVTSSQAATVQ